MRNVWIQTEYAFATWVADLTVLLEQPRELLDSVAAILAAGARHRVFEPVALPALGFDRGEGGDPVTRLHDLWSREHIVDAFGFTGAAMAPGAPHSSTVEAELAWFDRDDALVIARTSDLGSVLRGLEPVPGSIGSGFTTPFPPVRITGRRIAYSEGGVLLTHTASARRALEIRIAVHSDIWLPYVYGSSHPLADHQRYFDNRPLARNHTPRLNAMLRDVAAIAERAGGSFRVDPDETGSDAQRWLDARGVDLERAAPALFPDSAYDADWF